MIMVFAMSQITFGYTCEKKHFCYLATFDTVFFLEDTLAVFQQ